MQLALKLSQEAAVAIARVSRLGMYPLELAYGILDCRSTRQDFRRRSVTITVREWDCAGRLSRRRVTAARARCTHFPLAEELEDPRWSSFPRLPLARSRWLILRTKLRPISLTAYYTRRSTDA